MAVLHDAALAERLWYADDRHAIGIEPAPAPEQIQPASVDLRLGEHTVNPVTGDRREIDGELHLTPGTFVLAETAERVRVPNDLLGEMTGRSTVGRMGIVVHATAGLVDPGWDGVLTMEIANIGPLTPTFEPGDRMCQIKFSQLAGESSGYAGQYQDADTVESPGDI